MSNLNFLNDTTKTPMNKSLLLYFDLMSDFNTPITNPMQASIKTFHDMTIRRAKTIIYQCKEYRIKEHEDAKCEDLNEVLLAIEQISKLI